LKAEEYKDVYRNLMENKYEVNGDTAKTDGDSTNMPPGAKRLSFRGLELGPSFEIVHKNPALDEQHPTQKSSFTNSNISSTFEGFLVGGVALFQAQDCCSNSNMNVYLLRVERLSS